MFSVTLRLFLFLAGLVPAVMMAPVDRRAAVQCADVMVFFARGTTEPAPIGTVVGPPLKSALQQELGSQTLSFQGVDYPANVAGFLQGGDKQGSRTMADDITNAANSCPNAKIVTAGYSQGGQLVHNSAELLSPDVASRINAAIIFGDPDNGDPVSGVAAANTKVTCRRGDNICAGGALILPPHLAYGADTPNSAKFIASKV